MPRDTRKEEEKDRIAGAPDPLQYSNGNSKTSLVLQCSDVVLNPIAGAGRWGEGSEREIRGACWPGEIEGTEGSKFQAVD